MDSASCIRGSGASVALRLFVPIATSDSSPKVKCIATGAMLCADGPGRRGYSSCVASRVREFENLFRAKISRARVIHSGIEQFDANEKATRQRGGLLFKGE